MPQGLRTSVPTQSVEGTGDPVAKAFLLGTHRTAPPSRLLARLRPQLIQYGITRVGRLTGLDRIGIEVFGVTRPNGRGLSVAQGKGLTREAAELSGIMEAIELWHAETPAIPLRFASHGQLSDPLPRSHLDQALGRPLGDAAIFWASGTDLLTGTTISVPFDLVHACFTDDAKVAGAKFPVSTNGLASGATRLEAIIHAICEVVERHDTATLAHATPQERAARVLDLASIDDPPTAAIIEGIQSAGFAVRLWDTSGDIGLPSCVAALADLREPAAPSGFGAGCHSSRAIALTRALSEAAQARLTRISGARDDLMDSQFGIEAGQRARWMTASQSDAPCLFKNMPDVATDRLDHDLTHSLMALQGAGLGPVIAVTLVQNEDYAVVRVIIPGLQGYEVA